MLLKKLLDDKNPIEIAGKCGNELICDNLVVYKLPEIKESSIISLEYRFIHNDKIKIADVAHIVDDKLIPYTS